MRVELLYFDGCPNWRLADQRLRDALTQAGRDDVRVEHRRVTTPEQAQASGFRGSPTVLVDGRDPFADPDAPVGLSCRVFRTEAGLAGAPTVEQLFRVLS
ncbi:thioredoxin family protein [Blastococcus sp. KM273128]|uniref:DF family (seleno)protein n=1 Tax=Blastococcus sp. KM273128 TaxID=2570314 RepID=UPI001F3546EC|nr:thioredoxin family protein [Blastococcus sp. KM273128]MCF6746013.1 thioredoxin family protein [Blastococcus sp. KM273128]